jgi:(1->4)-alpha-D-glucan 1-alpha-D-glucosylmutase
MECRREHPELFQKGSYVPLVSSDMNQHLCAFARVYQEHGRNQVAIVAVPRLAYTLMGGKPVPPLEHAWGDAAIKLLQGAPEEFENIFTGERVQAKEGVLFCRDLFRRFHVCILSGR